jgi:hypothetical protein
MLLLNLSQRGRRYLGRDIEFTEPFHRVRGFDDDRAHRGVRGSESINIAIPSKDCPLCSPADTIIRGLVLACPFTQRTSQSGVKSFFRTVLGAFPIPPER